MDPDEELHSDGELSKKACKLEQSGEVGSASTSQALAALSEEPDLKVIIAECEAQWAAWCEKGHPLDCLRRALQDATCHTSVLKQLFGHMKAFTQQCRAR